MNAVATGRTSLAPLALLALLQSLEAGAGRGPSGLRDAPRPLDLPGLVVPHPRLRERRFVLAPLADLVPSLVVPGTGKTVARLLEEAPPARVDRWDPPPA